MAPASPPISSPCIRVCRLDAEGLCVGCHRSREEIAAWMRWSEAQRRLFMETVLRARATQRAGR
nr:DUF1289 domain-containing protein [Thermomonas hydrothermalis]